MQNKTCFNKKIQPNLKKKKKKTSLFAFSKSPFLVLYASNHSYFFLDLPGQDPTLMRFDTKLKLCLITAR